MTCYALFYLLFRTNTQEATEINPGSPSSTFSPSERPYDINYLFNTLSTV